MFYKFKNVIVFAIIMMFLVVPFASAASDNANANANKDKDVTDKTKESAKEIKNKDSSITGKITVTDSDTSSYEVSKEGDTAIKIKKNDVKGEHTKAKVSIPREELQKIDEDGDKLYGVLHIADDGTTTHDVVTESELTAGTEMTFSETIVSGYTGYYEKTQTGVTSGTTIDIPDVSGNYYMTYSVNGSIPTSSEGIPTSGLWGRYEADEGTGSVLHDTSGNNRNLTFVNASWASNDKGGSALVFSGYTKAPFQPTFGYNWSIYARHKPTDTATIKRLVMLSTSTSTTLMSLYSDPNEVSSFAARNTTPTLKIISNTPTTDAWKSVGATLDNTSMSIYSNGVLNQNIPRITPLYNSYSSSASWIGNGASASSTTEAYVGSLDKLYIYTRKLSASENAQIYTGASGISVRPIPSYNFTRYDVSSGVDKIIDTGSTTTGIEYTDTTGGTHTITIRIYFTEDITKVSETKGTTHQNVSIVHTKQNATASVGTIAYELAPLYSGTPILSSNNTNATISRNDTHITIHTGLLHQENSFYYNVSIPDDHDHVIFLNELMSWTGFGWDYANDAPDDWTGAIFGLRVTIS